VIATADRRRGLLLVLLSATGFASLAILGKVAYDEGLRTAEVLALRFGLAAPLLWLLVFARGRPQLPRSAVIRALAMGAVGYALQATLFFAALARIPAGLTALLLYLYPALVTAGAVLLGRHVAARATVVGLALGLVGTALVLGLPAERPDAVGVAFGLAAAFWYSGYILVGERVLTDLEPLPTAALVVTGAAVSFAVVGGLVMGDVDVGSVSPRAWLAALGVALLATVVAITAFFAGVSLVGATWASIASSWEPVCTVLLGVLLLGEPLGIGTVLGGLLVVGGGVVLPLLTEPGRTSPPPGRPRRRSAAASPER
jgi:drug/metabolite transporter (DMT)-like permease